MANVARATSAAPWVLATCHTLSSSSWRERLRFFRLDFGVSCGNTHTPDTARSSNAGATARSHPQQPPRSAPARRPQPPQLAHGNAHDREQKGLWEDELTEQGAEKLRSHVPEKASTGTRGFADVHASLDPDGRDGLFVEVKTDNLNKTQSQLDRLIREHVAQIDNYRFSPSFDHETTQAAIQFEHRPESDELLAYVERGFADAGITCIFLDD